MNKQVIITVLLALDVPRHKSSRNHRALFFTTFSFLRHLFLEQKKDVVFENIFYNPLKESFEEYNARVITGTNSNE